MKDAEAINPAGVKREVDPDQLLKLMDLQLASTRRERHTRSGRNAFRIWSLAFIIVATIVALLALQWTLDQLPKPEKATHNPAITAK